MMKKSVQRIVGFLAFVTIFGAACSSSTAPEPAASTEPIIASPSNASSPSAKYSTVDQVNTVQLPPPAAAAGSDDVTSARDDGDSSAGLDNDDHYTNVDGDEVHSPADSIDGSVPEGATAQCNDGTYSFSEHRQGTCSHHGGVAVWL